MKVKNTNETGLVGRKELQQEIITQDVIRKRQKVADSFLLSSKAPSGKASDPASTLFVAPQKSRRKFNFPINQQIGELRVSLLKNSREHFKRCIPYVIGVDNSSEEKIHFDLDRQGKSHFGSMNEQKDVQSHSVSWMKHLSSMHFYAFLNANTKPIDLGTFQSLEKKGLADMAFLFPLITPLDEPENSSVLYLLLAETNNIPYEAVKQTQNALAGLHPGEIENIKASFLVSAAESNSSAFLLALLKAKISPNSLDVDTGFYAINAARESQRDDNVKILIEYGANPDIKAIENS